MNNRGQFSIIAALFVAVILISTVVLTYSSIRNAQVKDQPQILSAIDETNFAIKQILGFTVGYYGSVLQVTGNSSYARMLALQYLQSGLVNIANMHPQWGTSFNLTDPDLSTNWFANRSYSIGDLAVNYNLTGLGIYKIRYETSCKLGVRVMSPLTGNQARLNITKDEKEPLINLGRQNFRFYRYSYADSSWELVNPVSEPTSFANGTYVVDIPTGVDPYSYVIQVEDQRGIIVVASSFSHYTCSLTWGREETKARYAVAGSPAQVLGAPDGTYATIGKDNTAQVTKYQGGNGTLKQVYFNLTYYGTVSGTLEWHYQLDGSVPNKIEDLPQGGTPGSPLRRTYNATGLRALWTWNDLNATGIQFKNNDDSGPENAYVDSIYMTVLTQSSDIYSGLKGGTVVIELLQNGTMLWLGQNLRLTTQAKPIPPIPVKTISVNQTINNVNRQVPFQIEDWNNNYQVPAGLTSNATVFSSRQMIVFLANYNTSKVTLWWKGLDTTTQTPYAFTNRYFTKDDIANGILTNGDLSLVFQGDSYRYADGFDQTNQLWSATGPLPYLNDNTASFISHNVDLGREGWFSFQDLTEAQVLAFTAKKSVRVDFDCRRDGSDDYFDFRINDGATTYGPFSITPGGSYGWQSYDVSNMINTTAKVNNAKVEVRYRRVGGGASNVYIRRCRLIIDFGGWLTSVKGTTSAKADFMRINSKAPTYGSNLAYIIHHGIVRDVIHQEAEWSGGITDCPNVYSQIVITLPANATYYTYKLRLMFVQSQQNRNIADLCPIKLTASSGTPQTENGTLNGYPIVRNGTGLFYNFSASIWAHHWNQIISATKGVGLMFTDNGNRQLYAFDSMAGSKTGAVKTDATARTIELLPVTRFPVQFTSALDISWHGAVVTFDGSTPIYRIDNGRITGLWIIAEYPPTVTVSTDS
jgi:hypothetical protein